MREIFPGVRLHTHYRTDWGTTMNSYLVTGPSGTCLIDPLLESGLTLDRIAQGPRLNAIVLTNVAHYRDAEEVHRRFGVPVYVHESGAAEVRGEQGIRLYRDGDILPGGLRPVGIAGAGKGEAALYMPPALGRPGLYIVGDALVTKAGQGLLFLPEDFGANHAKLRESTRKLLDHEFDAVLVSHGDPVVRDARAAVLGLLPRQAVPAAPAPAPVVRKPAKKAKSKAKPKPKAKPRAKAKPKARRKAQPRVRPKAPARKAAARKTRRSTRSTR